MARLAFVGDFLNFMTAFQDEFDCFQAEKVRWNQLQVGVWGSMRW